jgi:hypothetical protein
VLYWHSGVFSWRESACVLWPQSKIFIILLAVSQAVKCLVIAMRLALLDLISIGHFARYNFDDANEKQTIAKRRISLMTT